GAWNWINQNVFAPMNLGINTIGTFFGNLWTTVETVWGKISTFFADIAAGISSAVDTVKTAISDITKAIEDFIAEKFGLDDRPNGVFGLRPTGELLGVGPGSARGGIVPGVDPGRRDNVLMPLRSEEAVMVPEFTRAVGGAQGVFAMNRAAEAGRLSDVLGPGFARGGVVGQWAHDAVATPALALLEWAKGQIMEELSAQVGASGDMLADFGPENFSGPALNTQAAADFIRRTWPQITDIGTWRAAGSVAGSDHPKGKALDAMLPGYSSPAGKQLGTNVAEWFRTNPWNFGTKYVIYYDRIADGGGGWGPYSHPGGNNDTLAHRDHVHISFLSGKNPHYTAPVGDGAYPAGVEGGAFPPLVERWRSLGLDVLGKVGQYKGLSLTQYIDRMLNQIRTESSGDPNAINNYDINAQRGDPSIGLLQVIGSTFRNALKGTPFEYLIAAGQRDPRASLTSSTLYSLNRYGSLDKAWRGVAYDSGGWLMPGVTPTLNLLNRPEAVLTPPQSDALITHAQNLAGGFGGRAELDPGAIRQALDGMSMQLTDDEGNSFSARMRSTARSVMLSRERAQRSWG
ncbi:MAG TPA: hypothetical protein PLB92_00075, partial [Rhodoglobus sp.]|nr:hypothetical protein [Rhodoglobus sp.]